MRIYISPCFNKSVLLGKRFVLLRVTSTCDSELYHVFLVCIFLSCPLWVSLFSSSLSLCLFLSFSFMFARLFLSTFHSCFLSRVSLLHGILVRWFSSTRLSCPRRTGSERTTLLTVARSFVGGRPAESHIMHLKKYRKRTDTQYNTDTGKFHCPNCNNGYGRRDTMLGHYRYECGKAPRYKCPYCTLCSKKTSNIYQHVRCMHPKEQVTLVKLYWARAMDCSPSEDHEATWGRSDKLVPAFEYFQICRITRSTYLTLFVESSFDKGNLWYLREISFRFWLFALARLLCTTCTEKVLVF